MHQKQKTINKYPPHGSYQTLNCYEIHIKIIYKTIKPENLGLI